MNDIQVFSNSEFGSVRTVTLNGTPFFVGKDVAEILGYTNPQKALRDHVDDEDKTLNETFTVNGTMVVLINESGLYSLILSSKMPAAKRFKRWVTSEVLPTIRKHGMYAADALLADPDLAIAAFTALKDERAKALALSQTVAVQRQQISEMKPKADYYDVVLNCKDLVAISVIAKDYGWSANRMNKYLHSKGVQFKQGDIWLLYQRHAEQGCTSTKVNPYNGNDGTIHTKPHTYWTQKGRLFIYGLLKADGILPLIEQNGGVA